MFGHFTTLCMKGLTTSPKWIIWTISTYDLFLPTDIKGSKPSLLKTLYSTIRNTTSTYLQEWGLNGNLQISCNQWIWFPEFFQNLQNRIVVCLSYLFNSWNLFYFDLFSFLLLFLWLILILDLTQCLHLKKCKY